MMKYRERAQSRAALPSKQRETVRSSTDGQARDNAPTSGKPPRTAGLPIPRTEKRVGEKRKQDERDTRREEADGPSFQVIDLDQGREKATAVAEARDKAIFAPKWDFATSDSNCKELGPARKWAIKSLPPADAEVMRSLSPADLMDRFYPKVNEAHNLIVDVGRRYESLVVHYQNKNKDFERERKRADDAELENVKLKKKVLEDDQTLEHLRNQAAAFDTERVALRHEKRRAEEDLTELQMKHADLRKELDAVKAGFDAEKIKAEAIEEWKKGVDFEELVYSLNVPAFEDCMDRAVEHFLTVKPDWDPLSWPIYVPPERRASQQARPADDANSNHDDPARMATATDRAPPEASTANNIVNLEDGELVEKP